MRVSFTLAALDEIERVRDHIAQHDPSAAYRWARSVLARASQLEAFPRSGRRVPEFDREDVLEVFEGDWRIVYQLHEQAETIDVLAVIWGKRPLSIEEP